MIILEGCDCSGKTTLAEKLAKRYNAPVTHYSAHDHDIFIEHAKIGAPGAEEIADRFHLSEIPYTLYHRRGVPKYNSVAEIDLLLRETRCLQIVCTPPWLYVKARWEERKKEELIQNLESLHNIYMWYRDKSQAFSSFPIWKYDYTITPFNSLCQEIDTWSYDYAQT